MNKVEATIRAQASSTFRKNNPHLFGPITSFNERLLSELPKANKEARKAIRTSKQGILVNSFKSIWASLGGPVLEEEFKFHPERRFRSDFCHLPTRTCIEIEGGIFNKKGGHSSISGILRDIEKYNELYFLGFSLVRFHGKKGVAGSIDVPNLTRLIRFFESRKLPMRV